MAVTSINDSTETDALKYLKQNTIVDNQHHTFLDQKLKVFNDDAYCIALFPTSH